MNKYDKKIIIIEMSKNYNNEELRPEKHNFGNIKS